MVKGQAGADYQALGNNLANPQNAFCLANNPAIISNAIIQFGAYGQNKFTGTNLVQGGIASAYRKNNTAIGMDFQYAGTEVFHRRKSEIQLGQKWNNKISVGFSAGITGVRQQLDYGSKNYLTGKLAASFPIHSKLSASVVLVNPWRIQNALLDLESQIHIAVGYKVNEQTNVWAQTKQIQGQTSIYGIAIQYKLKQLCFHGSMQNGPTPIAAGVRYNRGNMNFSFGSGYHVYLGFTPSFSLLWVK